jgi:hypothetical protein
MTEYDRNPLTEAELAHLGEGSLAYLRQIDSTELAGKFPGMPAIAPGTKLWAVFAADGPRRRARRGAAERPDPGQHPLKAAPTDARHVLTPPPLVGRRQPQSASVCVLRKGWAG